jgi:hypothetical protein
MSAATVLAPVFVQVVLTFAILLWLGKLRYDAVKSGAVQMRDIALEQSGYPPEIQQVANAFRNQFELPVLFYLVSLLSLFTARASLTLVILAWLFVLTRIFHALIHVTTNNVPRRFSVYFVGAVILMLMWLVYGFSLYFGGSGSLPPLDIESLDTAP